MHFSRTMWRIIKGAYIHKGFKGEYRFDLMREVSTTIPYFYKRYLIFRSNTVERQAKFRVIFYKICGYPLHKFGFWDRKNHKSWNKKPRISKSLPKKLLKNLSKTSKKLQSKKNF